MKRSSRQAMALAFMLALAGPAAAIGVNNMVAWSAPDQPLRMDIELSDLGAARASDVTLRVASAADHSRLGLTRPSWADDVSFRVLDTSGSRVVVRATTRQPVSGDSVSFLVDIQALGQGSLQQLGSSLSDSASPLAPRTASTVQPQRVSTASSFADRPQPVREPRVKVVAPAPNAKPVSLAAAAPAQAAAAPAVAPAPAAKPAPVAKAAPAPAPAAPAAPAAAVPVAAAAPAADASTTAASDTAAPAADAAVTDVAATEPVADIAATETTDAAATPEATEPEPEAASTDTATPEGPSVQMEIIMLAILGVMLGGAFVIDFFKNRRS